MLLHEHVGGLVFLYLGFYLIDRIIMADSPNKSGIPEYSAVRKFISSGSKIRILGYRNTVCDM